MNEAADEALNSWLGALGGYFEARLSKGPDGWNLEGTAERWERYLDGLLSREEREALSGRKVTSISVATEPQAAEQWRTRLRLVEKSAARTLTDAPVGFAAVVRSAKTTSTRSTIVRFAFGFSLSLGHRIRRRFTAYYSGEQGNASFQLGDDHLFTSGVTVEPLDPSNKLLRKALPALSTAAKAAEESYHQEEEVVAEVERVRQRFAEELRCLERLYTSNWGRDAPVLGAAPEGLKGDDIVEAEYVTRLEDLVDRYRPRVLFEPLTIGLVEGWTPKK